MKKYFKIFRYLIAGSIATGTNLGVLFFCVHYLNLWYIWGTIISFCASVIVSYLLQKFWTFQNYTTTKIPTQFLHFFLFAGGMLGLNTLLMYFFVDFLGLWYLLAQALAALLIACINYLYFNKVIFKNI